MAKILLVEDDNNLREIYEARLQAEGYEIVAARDGEEALTIAMKEKPDLIISDVMMPKISGFDMLDILRSTEETKNTKVIMMTALSQAEDKARADKLGADRYLVKSQVTLEDVAKVAREVLNEDSPAGSPAASEPAIAPAPTEPAVATPAPAADPVVAPVAAPVPEPAIAPAPTEPAVATPAPAADPVVAPVAAPVPEPAIAPAPTEDTQAPVSHKSIDDEQSAIAKQIESAMDTSREKEAAETGSTPESPTSPSNNKRVIEPLNDINDSQSDKLDELAGKEQEKEQMAKIAEDISKEAAPLSDNDEDTAAAALKEAADNLAQAADTPTVVEAPASAPVEPPVTTEPAPAEQPSLVTAPAPEVVPEPADKVEPSAAIEAPAANEGVVQPAPPDTPAEDAVDPNSIAL
ncbi:MAG: CheY-like chemotaxis protein [Candidatus Saccharimonadales bacterium]|jgi:CheY-like chemotaxis protein